MKWDAKHKQLLTDWCMHCPDDHFAPYSKDLPHVGCCSYSPVFSMFEIRQMAVQDREFFWDQIYSNRHHVIKPYEIIIHAHVDAGFELIRKQDKLTAMEEEDLKLRFSVCPFFLSGKGCGLKPEYKNATCRSFICSAVEERLDDQQREQLHCRVREIRHEVDAFNRLHQARLEKRGWNFLKNMPAILDYLTEIEI